MNALFTGGVLERAGRFGLLALDGGRALARALELVPGARSASDLRRARTPGGGRLPDPRSRSAAGSWRSPAVTALERQNAAFAAPGPVEAPASGELVRRRRAALAATLGLLVASWVVSLRQMNGMDMGVATRLGTFASFVGLWVPMMAAMMLPGAVPALARHGRASGRALAVPLFVASYLAVWALVGVAVYAVYRPHGTSLAGAVAIAAGVYELTALKRHCRRRCRERVGSGVEFGVYCVGSSVGLMLVLLAVGVMSLSWMVAIAVLALGQKLLPPKAAIDVPLALAIVGLGVLIVVAPAAVPGLAPAM